MSMTEDERAALWRQQTQNRIAYKRELWLLLQAPPEPRFALLADWQPVIAWQAERDAGPTDPKDDP